MRTPNSFSSPESSEGTDSDDFEVLGVITHRTAILVPVPALPAAPGAGPGPEGVAVDSLLRFAFRAWAAYLRLPLYARPRTPPLRPPRRCLRVANAPFQPPRDRSPE